MSLATVLRNIILYSSDASDCCANIRRPFLNVSLLLHPFSNSGPTDKASRFANGCIAHRVFPAAFSSRRNVHWFLTFSATNPVPCWGENFQTRFSPRRASWRCWNATFSPNSFAELESNWPLLAACDVLFRDWIDSIPVQSAFKEVGGGVKQRKQSISAFLFQINGNTLGSNKIQLLLSVIVYQCFFFKKQLICVYI